MVSLLECTGQLRRSNSSAAARHEHNSRVNFQILTAVQYFSEVIYSKEVKYIMPSALFHYTLLHPKSKRKYLVFVGRVDKIAQSRSFVLCQLVRPFTLKYVALAECTCPKFYMEGFITRTIYRKDICKSFVQIGC